ncbi:17390_t:CDS:10 [Funneliformis geosporum]|nr:17390_t:CDS:10 [Funneliformis geosporum]
MRQISSGCQPFYDEDENNITQERKEEFISDTPIDYYKLYTDCLKYEPDKRPNMQQVVSSLDYTYKIIHDGYAKITDFGISKNMNTQNSSIHIGTFGRIPYVDPEKLKNLDFQYVKASDIYSYGVIMWEISSGFPPFKCLTSQPDQALLHIKICEGHREKAIEGTPKDYEELYKECWDAMPEKRPNIKKVSKEIEEMIIEKKKPAIKEKTDLKIDNSIYEDQNISNETEIDNSNEVIWEPATSHGLASAIIHAYTFSILSPDDVWLTIPQGQEEVFIDSQDIIVYINGNFLGNWLKTISRLSDSTEQRFKKVGLKQLLECDFSTSTSASITASQVILLDSIKKYCMRGGCGTPSGKGRKTSWETLMKTFGAYWDRWVCALFLYNESRYKRTENSIVPSSITSGFVNVPFKMIESFTPVGRIAHSSVLAENKLYFFGGVIDDKACSNEVFYLDVSQPFVTETPPWTDLTLNSGIPLKSCWGTVSSNEVQKTIYLFGGSTYNLMKDEDSFISNVYSFNLYSSSWNIPNVIGIAPERRRAIKSVIDNAGNMYIFGGRTCTCLGAETTKLFNDMITLNTVELSVSINTPVNAPSKRHSYTATLLSNGFIAYIGGLEFVESREVDIKQVYLYDTKSLTWSLKVCVTSSTIDNRSGHAAILTPEGNIIIHGGAKIMANLLDAPVTPEIFVLNMEAEQFEFDVPQIASNAGQVPTLTAHTANLVGNYMVVAFGNITQPNSEPLALKNPNIYLMDIRNYTWVNSFEATIINTKGSTGNETTNKSGTKPTNEPINKFNKRQFTMKIIIATVSGTLGTVIIVASIIFIYRRKRKSNDRRNSYVSPEPVESGSGDKVVSEERNPPGEAYQIGHYQN